MATRPGTRWWTKSPLKTMFLSHCAHVSSAAKLRPANKPAATMKATDSLTGESSEQRIPYF